VLSLSKLLKKLIFTALLLDVQH